MTLLAWQVWMILGIIFIIIEIFDPSFFFISLGIGAIVTGLISLLPIHYVAQILIFAVLSFISFLLTRKLGKKVLSTSGPETNVYGLIGQHAVVTKEIPAEGRGYAKVGGEEWTAVAEDENEVFELGAKVEITGIDGNKIIVKRHIDKPAED